MRLTIEPGFYPREYNKEVTFQNIIFYRIENENQRIALRYVPKRLLSFAQSIQKMMVLKNIHHSASDESVERVNHG